MGDSYASNMNWGSIFGNVAFLIASATAWVLPGPPCLPSYSSGSAAGYFSRRTRYALLCKAMLGTNRKYCGRCRATEIHSHDFSVIRVIEPESGHPSPQTQLLRVLPVNRAIQHDSRYPSHVHAPGLSHGSAAVPQQRQSDDTATQITNISGFRTSIFASSRDFPRGAAALSGPGIWAAVQYYSTDSDDSGTRQFIVRSFVQSRSD